MNLFEITKLLNLIEEYSELNYNQFVIEQQIHDKYLSNFSFRKTNKENFGSFLVRHNNSNVAYWLLLIRWNENQGFYLIIYPENRSTPLVEIHKFENGNLHWQYNPAKRDGNNAARVQYFQKYFYSSQVVISFPENTTEMEDFLQEIFELVDNRIKADNLDPNNPEERTSFPEGKRIEKKHYSRERNSNLIHFVKEKFKKKNGKVFCQVCNFNFEDKYGRIGSGFIEAHHTRPLSQLDFDGSETRVEEIILVCSNCHKIIHRYRPWLQIEELEQILNKNQKLNST